MRKTVLNQLPQQQVYKIGCLDILGALKTYIFPSQVAGQEIVNFLWLGCLKRDHRNEIAEPTPRRDEERLHLGQFLLGTIA